MLDVISVTGGIKSLKYEGEVQQMEHDRYRLRGIAAALIISVILTWAVAAGTCTATLENGLYGGWQPGPDTYHPNRVIVRFVDVMAAEDAQNSIEGLGYSLHQVANFKRDDALDQCLRIGVVELPDGESPDRAVSQLSGAPGILYAEKDYIRYPDQVYSESIVIPNDTQFPKMWGLHNENCQFNDPQMAGDPIDDVDTNMPEAWAIHTGSDEEVIVAVIDTGTFIYHTDLYEHIWVNPDEVPDNGIDDDGNGYIDDIWGWDFTHNDNSVWDPDERDQYGGLSDSHGTHCAGTIGALTNNGKGVSGINWNVKIICLKFIGPEGGYTSDAILALEYAADKGAKVINCSWGGGGYSRALKDAIEATGALVCCAAGNTGNDNDVDPHYPSSYNSPNIISVAAMMQNDMPCDYPGWWSTCYGATSVDLFAPGGFILSTYPSDPPTPDATGVYAFLYGTSMATPHVSGVSSLVHSFRPNMPLYPGAPGWSAGQPTVKDIILGTVDVKPQYRGKALTAGRLNAEAALLAAGGPIITSASADPKLGPPPLEVTFSATAKPSYGEIVDKWWDFGDGSESVHDWNATHVYTEIGQYVAAFHVVDDEGLESTTTVSIDVLYPSEIEVDPTSISAELSWGEVSEQVVAIRNNGVGDLDYWVELALEGMVELEGVKPLRHGGPDEFGYVYFDSDYSELVGFRWVDISEMGTRVPLRDDDSAIVDLPFAFPFYGEEKTQISIGSNGLLTFGDSMGHAWSNSSLPDPAEPNDLLAVFWDDLDPEDGGSIYCYGDENMFIVQWDNVPRRRAGGLYTFQAILMPYGAIGYNYKSMMGSRMDEATIGIENATGTVGLQVACDEDYVHDHLSVVFSPCWITVEPENGTISPGEAGEVCVKLAAQSVPEGDWAATVRIRSNDPINPVVNVETLTHIESSVPPMIWSVDADPWAGAAPLQVEFHANVEDWDGSIASSVWDFGDGSVPVTTEAFDVTHIYNTAGEYDAVLTVTDDDGLVATESVHVIVRPLPKAEINPSAISVAVRAHRTATEYVTVTNTGDVDLIVNIDADTTQASVVAGGSLDPAGSAIGETLGCDGMQQPSGTVMPTRRGGPDSGGYLWIDSNQLGGPEFDWVEIANVDTKIPELTDDEYVEIDLPWEFPFYGETKTSVKVNANGHLTFGPVANRSHYNRSIPDTRLPNDLLAVWWDDLVPGYAPEGGGVFYCYDEMNDRFIVEFKQVPRSLCE